MIDTKGSFIYEHNRVFLTRPDVYYSIGDMNPLKGSPYECPGRYYGAGVVRWSNGSTNTYADCELTLASNISGIEGNCVSIWEKS